jgi:ABC-type transporter Mla subunit MlaD
MASGTQNAKDVVSNVADKTKDVTSSAVDRTRDMASHAVDRARDMAGQVADKAKDAASSAGHRAEQVTEKVGSGLSSAAESIRQHAPDSGMLHRAADKVADTLDSSGRYLKEEGLSGMANDLTELIKRNPIPAVLVGICLGALIGRATRS